MADNVEIQGLEFEIIGDSVSAEDSLNKLKETLVALKTAVKGGVSGVRTTGKQITALKDALAGFDNQKVTAMKEIAGGLKALGTVGKVKLPTTVSKRIEELKSALAGFNSNDAEKLKFLAGGLTALGAVGQVKISSTIATQITALKPALDGLDTSATNKLVDLAAALKPLSEIGRAHLTSLINQLGKLPALVTELETVDLDKFTRQMTDLAAAMKPFADEMAKVASGFAAFPSRIQRLITSTEQYNSTVRKATNHTGLWSKALKTLSFASIVAGLRRVSTLIAQCVKRSNDYQESLNLFTVALGEYAAEAQAYAQKVSDAMGIDTAEWMKAQGVFNTLLTGFGNVADRAYVMSSNLTQLGYDLASFFNISVEDAFQKLQSGISGELEPLRRLGYDLSQARLEAVALSLGIDKAVSAMTQAEKAELRYYAIMTQVTTAQGDMARTLQSPANQLRILKAQLEMCARSIGNIFIPMLNAVLPYAIAFTQALREIADALAELFEFTLTEVDYSGIGDLASGATEGADAVGEITEEVEDTTEALKKLKQYTMGFDELNIISPDTDTGVDDLASALEEATGGSGFGFELPTYDFLGDAVNTRVEEIRQKLEPMISWVKTNMDEILTTVGAIGTGILAWKVSAGLIAAIDALNKLKGKNIKFTVDLPALGVSMFLADLQEIQRYLEDLFENGATFTNVAGIIAEFAGMIGDAALVLGQVKLGGALKVVQGVGEIVSAISDIAENGLNWENALTAIRGLTNIAIAIEVMTGNIKAAGWTVAIQGLTTVVREIATNWEAIRNGDWSGVDKAAIITGGLEILGGLVVAMDGFSKLKQIQGLGGAATATQKVTEAVTNLETSVSPLTSKLKDLATNLGWGLLIVTEVAAAAVLIVGAIYVLGKELAAVGEAWKPVIDNAGTVVIAVGVGTGLIAAVGLAAYGLGTLGATAALNIGIGTAILAELGVATGLFLAEIWAIGWGLDEIGQAWQPVLDNGSNIATAIGVGTGLLVAVGVATAALGAATVASAGLLPVAIAVGTALLVELAAAFVLFTESIVAVANEISNNLSPALDNLNPKLPTLKTQMSNFTEYTTSLASEITTYSDSMGNITWSSIVTSFQKLFKGNPIKSLAEDIDTIRKDVSLLNDKLKIANPELELAVRLMTSYSELMTQLEILTNGNSVYTLASNMYTNLKTVGEKLVVGFADGMKDKTSNVKRNLDDLKTTATTAFSDMGSASNTSWKTNLDAMTSRFNSFKTNSMSGLRGFSTQFKNVWMTMWTGVGNTFVTIWNKILTRLENGLNSAITATNNAARSFNAMSGITGRNYSLASRVSIPRVSFMKDGGFVDEGQLFIAREKGAEMVGSMNHRTTVANNDQIVDGIRAGVYEAVIAAMGSVQQTGEMIVKVFLDGKEVTANVEKHQRERGVSIMGGVVYG